MTTPNTLHKLQLLFIRREFNKCLSACLTALPQYTRSKENKHLSNEQLHLDFQPISIDEKSIVEKLQKAKSTHLENQLSNKISNIIALIFQSLFELNHSSIALKILPVLFEQEEDNETWKTKAPNSLILMHSELLVYLNQFDEAQEILSESIKRNDISKNMKQKMEEYMKTFPSLKQQYEQERNQAQERQEFEQQMHEEEQRFTQSLRSQFSKQQVLQNFFHQNDETESHSAILPTSSSSSSAPEGLSNQASSSQNNSQSSYSSRSPFQNQQRDQSSSTTKQSPSEQLYAIFHYILSVIKPYKQGILVAFVAAVLFLVFFRGASASTDSEITWNNAFVSPARKVSNKLMNGVRDLMKMGFSPYRI